MNKKLVAVAIAGLLAAPLAQAQTANVTLYGRANLDMEFVNGKKAGAIANTNPTIFRVSSNSSRFGLRGTESLGGGLNAIFQIENGSIPMDTGGGNLAGRDSFVGLSGGWGKFYIGKYSAPYDAITDIQGNNTNNTGILSTGALWAQASQDFGGGGFDTRWNNAIRYDSPSWSGFAINAEYASGEGAAGISNSGIQSYLLKYDNGPFMGRAAYEFHHNMRGTVNNALSDSAFSIAALWQFSGWNIAGTYEWLDYDATQSTSLKRQYWQIQSTINVGANGSLYLMYGSASNGKGSASDLTPRIGSLAHGSNTGASNWQVAYAHALSKRTSLFAGYMKVNNDSRANYSFGGNSYAVAPGGDPQGFSAGMWHNF